MGDPLEQHQDWCLLHYSCSDTLVLEISVITNTNGKFSMDAAIFQLQIFCATRHRKWKNDGFS